MTLLDAPGYDAARVRRTRLVGIAAVGVLLVTVIVVIAGWNWPSEHRVDRFLTAIEAQDYVKAFGIWNNDAHWQEHAARYDVYPFKRFLTDWGPASEYGLLREHRILYATSHLGKVTLVAVRLRGSREWLSTFAVSRQDHRLDFFAFDLAPGEKLFGYTRWQISRHYEDVPLSK